MAIFSFFSVDVTSIRVTQGQSVGWHRTTQMVLLRWDRGPIAILTDRLYCQFGRGRPLARNRRLGPRSVLCIECMPIGSV